MRWKCSYALIIDKLKSSVGLEQFIDKKYCETRQLW